VSLLIPHIPDRSVQDLGTAVPKSAGPGGLTHSDEHAGRHLARPNRESRDLMIQRAGEPLLESALSTSPSESEREMTSSSKRGLSTRRWKRLGTVPEAWAWQAAGKCRGEDGSLFFGPPGEGWAAQRRREGAAVAVCNGCPVIEDCRRHGLAVPERYGVWGGLTERERRITIQSGLDALPSLLGTADERAMAFALAQLAAAFTDAFQRW
jgi:WhiB family redox-sensing transcriptional regulator